ncbi:RloB domain-containing protein [Pseudactinotalea sp. HY158]|nr:RloB domain-containing protein [Pseudactinotalea sp. HY158]
MDPGSVCLVDVDTHTTLKSAIETAQREGIDLLVTRLKFETWLYWHVSESRAAHSTRQLDELMSKHKLLRDGKHLATHFPFASVDDAIRTARAADLSLGSCRCGPDPSSGMPVLVELMRGLTPRT